VTHKNFFKGKSRPSGTPTQNWTYRHDTRRRVDEATELLLHGARAAHLLCKKGDREQTQNQHGGKKNTLE
jgi:hypothetical protein